MRILYTRDAHYQTCFASFDKEQSSHIIVGETFNGCRRNVRPPPYLGRGLTDFDEIGTMM